MAALFDNHFQANDANGAPMAGAKLTFFVAGTTTALVTYQDAGATTPHANPVVADAMGLFPPIYIVAPLYKFVLQTAGNVTIQTVDPASSILLPSYTSAGLLYGMGTYNDISDLSNNIGISSGVCIDQTNTKFMQFAGMIKKLADPWAPGTNAGGRSSADPVADGTWHIFSIFRSDLGTSDILFSQGVSPVLPTNYTHQRRIASFMRVGGVNLRYDQVGDNFRYRTPVADLALANPGTTSVARTVSVPLLFSPGVRASIRLAIQSTVVSQVINGFVNDTAMADYALGALSDVRLSSLATAGTYRAEVLKEVQVSFSQVNTKLDFSSAGVTLILTTYGWTDDRGRFGGA